MTATPPEGALPALGGRYRLVERIARGGMGEVWRAFDEVLGRPVAVKVLRPEYADEQVFLERFRNEARNTAALVHTGIAAVYDFGQATLARTTVPFIVMELVPGRPLSQIIERDGALDRDRALDLAAQAARGLHAAHEGGVVHRDVKPANLLVTPTWTVKITDFGIARAGDALPLTRAGTVMGTAHYLAPELVNGRGVASASSDVYALGVVLYECLAGRRPFIGENPLSVAMEHLNSNPPPIPGLHPAIQFVLDGALAKDPINRPASAEVLAHQLLALRIELAAGVPTPEEVARSIGEQADSSLVRRAASRSARAGHRRGHIGALIPAPVAPSDPRAIALPDDLVTGETALPIQGGAGRHRAALVTPRRGHRVAGPSGILAGRRPIVIGTAVAVVTLGLGIIWLTNDDPTVAVVPAVAGTAEHDATKVIKAGGFDIRVAHSVDESVPAGVVLTQSPAPGTKAATHSAVSIVVSAGPNAVTIDPTNLLGRPFTEVSRALTAQGLVVVRRQIVGGGAPGTVTDVSPHGPVPVGASVTVSVVGPAVSGARYIHASVGNTDAWRNSGRNGR
ncbi:MAG TPA: protein kinase [Sporichthyaceae bacterium]|jgi:serine/threonine-protein kinase